MNRIIYNIPAALFPRYRKHQVVARSRDPFEIVRKLSAEKNLDNLQYAQLLSPEVDAEALETLANWECGAPLDIVVADPATQFPLLYNFSKLLKSRPVRVTINVKPGFIKAVKLALALHFAVKLEVGQPDAALTEEMLAALEFYLHRPNVTEPVEYFHSIFLSFYRNQPLDLWLAQEEDPDHFRFVDDEGRETVSPRFIAAAAAGNFKSEPAVRSSEHECDACEFRAACGGYFKWTERNYDCAGVKNIFETLRAAAAELKENVAFAATVAAAATVQKGVVQKG